MWVCGVGVWSGALIEQRDTNLLSLAMDSISLSVPDAVDSWRRRSARSEII